MLGNQNFLFHFDTETAVLTTLANTQRVSIIGGLAIEPGNHNVHILDYQHGTVVEIELGALGLE